MMQIEKLFPEFDKLHSVYGDPQLTSIYGAGEISNPRVCLIFMNPTARNISSTLDWKDLKAPWLGTKNVWKLLYDLKLFKNKEMLEDIFRMKPSDWNPQFCNDLYKEIAKESLYITNIAKCTQSDAKHIPDSVYKKYLPLMLEELETVNPQTIITFGNQVSSILLQKPISVSKYQNSEFEILRDKFKVYPSYYPIGQGMRNISKAKSRIQKILNI